MQQIFVNRNANMSGYLPQNHDCTDDSLKSILAVQASAEYLVISADFRLCSVNYGMSQQSVSMLSAEFNIHGSAVPGGSPQAKFRM